MKIEDTVMIINNQKGIEKNSSSICIGCSFFVFRHFKTARFFLCTVERYSIIKPVFLHKFKSLKRTIGKPDESLGRKATGPVKWQPVA